MLKKVQPVPLASMAEYLTPFASHFKRSEGRESLERHVTGLLADNALHRFAPDCSFFRATFTPTLSFAARNSSDKIEVSGLSSPVAAQMSTYHLYAGAARILTTILQLALLQKAEVSRPVEDNVIQQVDAYD